jgi:hypothetical protein
MTILLIGVCGFFLFIFWGFLELEYKEAGDWFFKNSKHYEYYNRLLMLCFVLFIVSIPMMIIGGKVVVSEREAERSRIEAQAFLLSKKYEGLETYCNCNGKGERASICIYEIGTELDKKNNND